MLLRQVGEEDGPRCRGGGLADSVFSGAKGRWDEPLSWTLGFLSSLRHFRLLL